MSATFVPPKNRLPTSEELQELWRPDADLIGPLMPPMLLWFARGRPKDAWQIAGEARHFHQSSVQPDLFAEVA